MNQIERLAEMPAALPAVRRSPDPHDDFLLALCEAGRAEWLVTGDKADLLALASHAGTRITAAAALARELRL
jgi:predicted nucleic acid-binding protein